MNNVLSLPRVNLSDIADSELKNTVVTKKSFADSKNITLGHYIKIGDNELLLGNSKIKKEEGLLYLDFNPFVEIIKEEKEIMEKYYFNESKVFKKDFADLVNAIDQKNSNEALASFNLISNIKENERAVWKIYFYETPLPEGLIKNYRGKFDVMAHIQTLDYLKNTFSNTINRFSIRQVKPDTDWKETLREMGMNVGKIWYHPLRLIGAHVDENFNKYYDKAFSYAQKKGFV